MVERTSTVTDGDVDLDTIARIEREFTLLLRRAEVAGARRPEADRLVRSAYLLLIALETNGPLGIAALAEATQVDISTASRQIPPLEEQQFVRRLSNPSDRRGSVIELTPLGRERLQATRDERRATFMHLLADWPEQDRAAFAAYLAHLNAAIAARQRQSE
jgi:DNA-binding MarR family transcriptional regulator